MQEQTSHLIQPALPTIPWSETTHHPHSYADSDGRVFSWEGQLYRGIFPAASPFFKRLAESGIISDLVEHGLLVHTELTQFNSNEFSLIFRHQRIPFASYPQEWCPLMLKDAALAIVDLAIELAADELTLKDGHPWNVLFDACKPVYIDLGSIVPLNGSYIWSAYPDFCRYCLYPLILMSKGYDPIGRLMMHEERGVREGELFRLAPELALRAHMHWHVNVGLAYAEKYLTYATKRFLQKVSIAIPSQPRQSSRDRQKVVSFLKQLRRLVESIPLSRFDSQEEVRESSVGSVQENDEARGLNAEGVSRLLTELHPDSILDLNSGIGSLAKQAASLGSRVIYFDTNLRNVTRLFGEAKRKGLPILPLVMDFMKPTPARGLGDHWAIAATERFQCDLVLGLDLMTQPAVQRLGFENIINGLGQFSKRWLVMEIPTDPGNDCIQRNDNQPRDFSVNSSIGCLEKQFRRVTKMDSWVKGRTLLVCEK